MSIHVVSAVLKCRDPNLTSSRRMVLVVLANYAGEDGRSWPSQQLIADEAGCGIRSLKDHLKYLEAAEFITRHTRNLGQGKGSRTSYQIHLRRLAETRGNAGEDFACADFARANNVTCEGSIPHLTNRHEPSVTIEGKPSIVATSPEQAVQKGSGRVRGPARKTVLPESWQPGPAVLAYASKLNFNPKEISHEENQFRASAVANARRYADWDAAFRTWIGNAAKWRDERAAKGNHAAATGRQSSGSSVLAAGMRAVADIRGYGQSVSEGGGLGTGHVIEGDLF